MNTKEKVALNHILDAFEPLILAYTTTIWEDGSNNLAEVLHNVLDLAEAFILEPKAAKAINNLINVRDTCVRMMGGYRTLRREILEE